MQQRGAVVGAWVSVWNGCPISYNICGDQVEVVLGGPGGFEMLFTEGGLRDLITTGSQALVEMRAGGPRGSRRSV